MIERLDEIGRRLRESGMHLPAGLAEGHSGEADFPSDGIRAAAQVLLAEKMLSVTVPEDSGMAAGGTGISGTKQEMPDMQNGYRAGRNRRTAMTPYEAARETRRQSELLLRT